jgi:hypothetical protein
MDGLQLTGLTGKVTVVTGAGRMRSIGRPIAIEMAMAGCRPNPGFPETPFPASGNDPSAREPFDRFVRSPQ